MLIRYIELVIYDYKILYWWIVIVFSFSFMTIEWHSFFYERRKETKTRNREESYWMRLRWFILRTFVSILSFSWQYLFTVFFVKFSFSLPWNRLYFWRMTAWDSICKHSLWLPGFDYWDITVIINSNCHLHVELRHCYKHPISNTCFSVLKVGADFFLI